MPTFAMENKYLSKWLIYMDWSKYNGMLWELVREDISPGRKLDELLYQLTIPDRISFLKYIRLEYKEGVINDMLAQRHQHEEPPKFLYDKANHELTPRDLFYLHLQELTEKIDYLCKDEIPAKLKLYEREIADMAQREKVLSTLNLEEESIGPDEELLTAEEAAKYLKVELSTLYSYNHKRLLIPYTPGGKLLRYTKSQLDNFRKNKK